MTRAIVKAPGVNLLSAAGSEGRVLTLEPGRLVDVREGRPWPRVEVDGLVGFVPAAALEFLSVGRSGGTERLRPAGIEPLEGCDRFVGEVVSAHRDFHEALRRLNGYAAESGVKIDVLHSFRQRDVWVEGVDLPSHKRSNHLVGHAIDMNVMAEGQRFNSRKLLRTRWSDLPHEVKEWIRLVREDDELRWGGDFVRPDPVHIDDDLYRREPSLWFQKLRAIAESPAEPFHVRGSLNERN
ncbi:M15 family metallopeptidase [Myxococcota bacterium]|nr:M15 family metallopeptidase [Myxococcota bacterium]